MEIQFFSVKDMHCRQVLTFFVITYRVTNFLSKLMDMLLFSPEKKMNFNFLFSPTFRYCPPCHCLLSKESARKFPASKMSMCIDIKIPKVTMLDKKAEGNCRHTGIQRIQQALMMIPHPPRIISITSSKYRQLIRIHEFLSMLFTWYYFII